VRHGHYLVFRLAEVVVPRSFFIATLCRTHRARTAHGPLAGAHRALLAPGSD
jgi:hypothetical protein